MVALLASDFKGEGQTVISECEPVPGNQLRDRTISIMNVSAKFLCKFYTISLVNRKMHF